MKLNEPSRWPSQTSRARRDSREHSKLLFFLFFSPPNAWYSYVPFDADMWLRAQELVNVGVVVLGSPSLIRSLWTWSSVNLNHVTVQTSPSPCCPVRENSLVNFYKLASFMFIWSHTCCFKSYIYIFIFFKSQEAVFFRISRQYWMLISCLYYFRMGSSPVFQWSRTEYKMADSERDN